eukprot:CAMPEP_0179029262 /NCGR_PEP_ID=MMETSP0796-20121207/9965_1 /TAXON_ID=73915 /ORGANISM="Pyrodinium bahamense, Strain pbaha01" /LENGTH=92 /DNA_ID=CAMNT_0020725419 /DNA_START=197 /DNA_END=472 /DNA_ORIENTATION=+
MNPVAAQLPSPSEEPIVCSTNSACAGACAVLQVPPPSTGASDVATGAKPAGSEGAVEELKGSGPALATKPACTAAPWTPAGCPWGPVWNSQG